MNDLPRKRRYSLAAHLALYGLGAGIITAVVCVCVYFWPGALAFDRGPVYTTTAAVFATMVGVCMTTLSIVVVVISDDRLTRVLRSGHGSEMSGVFVCACIMSGAAALWSLVALAIDKDKDHPMVVGMAVCVGLTMASTLAVGRAIKILHAVAVLVLSPKANESH